MSKKLAGSLVPNLAEREFGTLWLVLAIIIFVYSYGFVDLNLTLSSAPLLFNFVTWVQHLVYFDRPLSLKIFIFLICSLFLLYIGTLFSQSKNRLTKFPWKITVLLSLIFSLAYPMLSSDVFKYLFSAKEILVYHANPYLFPPNTFPQDSWIRFMRWVHTTIPYGPAFTALTIPYYLIGFGKFVPILYLFKLDQAAWYLLSIWFIGKIAKSQKWEDSRVVLAQLFFTLNPLVLMEWLVNAHNDAIMITLLLGSIYFLTLQKRAWSFVSLLLSIGIKYVTAIFIPILLFPKLIRRHFSLVIYYLLIILTLTPLLYHYSWQYQPWYVTWLIPLAALIPNRLVRWSVAAYSFSVFSRYLYFVGTGSWLGTPMQHAIMTFLPPVIIAIMSQCSGFLNSKKSSGSQLLG